MSHIYRSQEETLAILRPLVHALTAKLGAGWSFSLGDYTNNCLDGPGEAKLYLSLEGDSKGDRISISGGFHIGKTAYGSPEYVRPRKLGIPSNITVALACGTDAIIAAVQKRYLPVYLPALAEARTIRDADAKYKADRLANMQRLVALTGDARTVANGDTSVYLKLGEQYGQAEVLELTASPYANSVTLKLHSLTMQQAERIIKALKEKP